RNAVEHKNVDVWFEFVRLDRRIDCLVPKLDCDIVRHELTFARIIQKCLAHLRTRVDGAEHIAARAMIKTRDRAEGFALRAFAAAGGAEKNEGSIFHGKLSLYCKLVETGRPKNGYRNEKVRDEIYLAFRFRRVCSITR